MKPEQINDAPDEFDELDELPVEGRRLEFILAFLNFHRRLIFGTLLLAGVAYFLVRVNNPSPVGDEGNAASTASAIDSNSQTVIGPSSNQAGGATVKNAAPIEPQVPATTDEKIDELLSTAGSWSELGRARSVNFLEARIEQLRELFQAPDLKPRQRNYCDHHFIDSVGLLCGLSQSSNSGIEGIEALVAEVEQTYAESEDLELAAAAKLVVVRYFASLFVVTESEESFLAFENVLLERQAAILESNGQKELFSKIIYDTFVKVSDHDGLRQIAIEHLSHVVDLRKPVAGDLATSLFFSKLDLDTLPIRVRKEVPEADADVQSLLNQLEQHPDVPLQIYSVLVSSIARYQDIGENEKAQQLIERLRKLAPAITIERIRDQVMIGIDMVESDDQGS